MGGQGLSISQLSLFGVGMAADGIDLFRAPDITSMPGLEAVIDVIYNPDKTELILRAEELGVLVAVGRSEEHTSEIQSRI